MPKKPATREPQAPTWAERVAALMSRYRLTQAQLGKRVGVKHPIVSKWANGASIPSEPIQKLLMLMERGQDLGDLE